MQAALQTYAQDKQNGNLPVQVLNAIKHFEALLKDDEVELETEKEREQLVQMMLLEITSDVPEIKQATSEVLNCFIDTRYDFLQPFFPALSKAMVELISNYEDQTTGGLALEFFFALAEIESQIAEENLAMADEDEDVREMKGYVQQSLLLLLPALMDGLLQQTEENPVESFSTVCGACLGEVARFANVSDKSKIMKFIHQNLRENAKSESWRYREAGAMALGASIDVLSADDVIPEIATIQQMLRQASNDVEKDTAAWALGRIAKVHVSLITLDMVKDLFACLNSSAKVATNGCFALFTIADAIKKRREEEEEEDETSEEFAGIVNALLAGIPQLLSVGDRTDTTEDLETSGYESINAVIESAFPDDHEHVKILHKLVEQYCERINSGKCGTKTAGLLCAGIQSACLVLPKESIMPISLPVSQAIFTTLSNRDSAAVQEALIALVNFTKVLEEDFAQFVAPAHSALLEFLGSSEKDVFVLAATLLGEITRAIPDEIAKYGKEYIAILTKVVGENSDLKMVSTAMEALSDCGLAFSTDIMEPSVTSILNAALPRAEGEFDENVVFGFLTLCTGILQGLGTSNRQEAILGYVARIVAVASRAIEAFTTGKGSSEIAMECCRDAVGLFGDIAKLLGKYSKDILIESKASQLVAVVAKRFKGDQAVREILDYTTKQLKECGAK